MRISWLSILLWFSTSAFANHQTITLVLAAQNDNGHAYYHELLARALADQGISLVVETPYTHLPQKRVVKMVENNQLSLTWLLETPERNKKVCSCRCAPNQWFDRATHFINSAQLTKPFR